MSNHICAVLGSMRCSWLMCWRCKTLHIAMQSCNGLRLTCRSIRLLHDRPADHITNIFYSVSALSAQNGNIAGQHVVSTHATCSLTS